MKTLQEYSLLKCGKHINEGLFIKKNTEIINLHEADFKIPIIKDEELYINNCETISVPRHRYFIYNDVYRNCPHLGSIDDMLYNIALHWEGDFEDVHPKKLILFSSDNYKKVLEWYFEEYFNVPPPTKKDDIDEYIDKHKDKFYNNGKWRVNDSIKVLCEFYLGKDIIPIDNKFDFDDKDAVINMLSDYYKIAE